MVESMVISASTLGALGASDGGKSVIWSILPTRTPARRTSDPSRNPLASMNRAFKCSFLLNGLISPDALRIRKTRIAIAASMKKPTRSSRNETVFFDLGMASFRDEGGRRKDEPCHPRFHPSSYIFHPFLMSSQKLLNVGILGPSQALVSSAEDDVTVAHHHHFTVY